MFMPITSEFVIKQQSLKKMSYSPGNNYINLFKLKYIYNLLKKLQILFTISRKLNVLLSFYYCSKYNLSGL